jgi:hypothetical protein
MCVVEQKTYYQPDGSQRTFDSVRRCKIAIDSGIDLCPNATQTSDTVRIVEVKPETVPSSSTKQAEFITKNKGQTHVYRDVRRRASPKHKTGDSKPSNNRNSIDSHPSSSSRVFETFSTKKALHTPRPTTPKSAPPIMASFPPTLPSERSARVHSSGTAVYDVPSSLFNIPRAVENERRTTEPSRRKVSFGDGLAGPRRPSLSVHTGAPQSPPTKSSPGLSRLPSIRQERHKRTDSAHDNNTPRGPSPSYRTDQEYAARESARETARRQRALDEAIRRRQEDLEVAENASLDREAERAQYRRSFDPLHRLPDTLHPPRSTVDSEHSSWSRHTSPPAPPSHPRPTPTRTRFASSSPLSAHTIRSHRSYGHATVHQYHYPDSPAASSSRRPSDSIRERGREVIERERAKAATEDSAYNRASAAADEYIASPGTSRYWEPVFDEVDERVSGREYYYVSEGSARQEIRRRRDRDDSRRRGERRMDEFHY